ncbi:MAG: hypothetical protein CL868_07665 [Cytophagaceae bacterium]|nr:hypothetical protein [Cytophagaceae bacterium]|tara:strand:- start:14902 stop:15720 length:819 start_codon:yes stop_codon:yes gene_type:complete
MKKAALTLLAALSIIACAEKTDNKEEAGSTEPTVDTTQVETQEEEEITDPKVTEVWDPEPAVVTFDKNGVPSDAEVLFNGKDLSAWKSTSDSIVNARWKVNSDGSMTVAPGTGPIQTKENFDSFQLHVEWQAPQKVEGEGQGRGNSGIFLQGLYEVQVLDSYDNRTYSNGQASSLYKQHIPLVNATKPTKEWQTYDIIFHEPKYDADGKTTRKGTVTVLHNGVLVQDNVELAGTTEYIGRPKVTPHEDGPIILQDHGNPVSFRNIWIRKLND